MSTNRYIFDHTAVVHACLLLMAVGAQPLTAQAPESVEIDVRLSEAGSRMIGETEKNMVDVLGAVTVHLTGAPVGDVVLVLTHVDRGKVIARGESAPFRIDAEAAAARGGVPLGRALGKDMLLGVAPLRPAEFMVTGHSRAERQLDAVGAVADPGPAFPMMQRQVVIVAVVPADRAARRGARVRPLLFVTTKGGR